MFEIGTIKSFTLGKRAVYKYFFLAEQTNALVALRGAPKQHLHAGIFSQLGMLQSGF